MEFAIGFVTGGVLSGVAVVNAKGILAASRGGLAKAAELGRRIASKAGSFRSKL